MVIYVIKQINNKLKFCYSTQTCINSLNMVKIKQNSLPGVSVATITEQGEECSWGNLLKLVSGLQKVSAFSLYSLVYSINKT